GARDSFRVDRVALAILEELQPGREQPVDDLRRGARSFGSGQVLANLAYRMHEAIRERVVAVVGEPGFAFGALERRRGVEIEASRVGRARRLMSPTASPAVSRPCAGERAATCSPAMPP